MTKDPHILGLMAQAADAEADEASRQSAYDQIVAASEFAGVPLPAILGEGAEWTDGLLVGVEFPEDGE